MKGGAGKPKIAECRVQGNAKSGGRKKGKEKELWGGAAGGAIPATYRRKDAQKNRGIEGLFSPPKQGKKDLQLKNHEHLLMRERTKCLRYR